MMLNGTKSERKGNQVSDEANTSEQNADMLSS